MEVKLTKKKQALIQKLADQYELGNANYTEKDLAIAWKLFDILIMDDEHVDTDVSYMSKQDVGYTRMLSTDHELIQRGK